jgi:hypothetical protein
MKCNSFSFIIMMIWKIIDFSIILLCELTMEYIVDINMLTLSYNIIKNESLIIIII